MFDIERFIEDSRDALAVDRSHKAVRELVSRAIAEPADILASLGEPTEAGVHRLHHAADLTIVNVVWAPQMTVMPHNHEMWAVIGIYTGAEDNIFGAVPKAGSKPLAHRHFVTGMQLRWAVTSFTRCPTRSTS